ncbi:MAG: phosphopantetheine-binding protein [Vicingaceae bacterium]|tara:strand:- start:838 stop:1056 length:219 start_codon:yes stop_codon:yes gene_type:complete
MKTFLENFSEILEDTLTESLSLDTEFKDLDDWDSMTMLMLISLFDEKYSLEVSASDINKLDTLNELYLLTKK